ncbi:hypothetical protein WL95_17645 [Burkholderia cepacia]|nr:hypothetical protein WL95_17645 [Burkholderia cepacia]
MRRPCDQVRAQQCSLPRLDRDRDPRNAKLCAYDEALGFARVALCPLPGGYIASLYERGGRLTAPAMRPCGQLSRNDTILRVSSLFSTDTIAHPRLLAYGAGRPRPIGRPDTRPSSRTTAARAVPAVTVSAAPPIGAAHS